MASLLPIPLLVLTVFLLIRAELHHKSRQVFLFKPLSSGLVLIVALLSFLDPGVNRSYTVYLLAGLLLSLGGDVALVFGENRRAFLTGLVLFLFAHLVYFVAFNFLSRYQPRETIISAVALLAGATVYVYLLPGLRSLKLPVAVYVLVISAMVSQAVSTLFDPVVPATQARLVSLGAILFWLSDLILAIDRFRVRLRYYPLNLAVYYTGQLLVALSA